jgi:kynurenine formamidase
MATAGDGLPNYAQLLDRTDAPPGSTWGLFGEGDEIGAANLLTPDRAVRAASLVRRGVAFSLDHPVNAFELRRPLAKHTILSSPVSNDDYLDEFYLQGSSQIDGLRHFTGGGHGFYGGVPGERLVTGDPTLGVNRWADRCLVGRGVLVDVARHREAAGEPLRHEPLGDPISVELLEEVLAAQRTQLEPADMLLIRTDYRSHYERAKGTPTQGFGAGLAQADETLAWLWDHSIPLIAADNVAVEALPVWKDSPRRTDDSYASGLMHGDIIGHLGMIVGELWNLDDLAADCAQDHIFEFMLVVKPLNLVGGVGSPPNATAIK